MPSFPPFRAPAPPPFATLPAPGPLVSVLVRTRDRPVLLARALASVLAQTEPPREIVVVNDGGAPGPVEDAAARHRDGLPILVLHNAAPSGRWPAANRALGASGGALVALLDDDDSWEPGFLAAAVARLRAPDAAGLAAVCTHWNRIEEEILPDGRIVALRSAVHSPGLERVAIEQLFQGGSVQPQALVVRREAIERAGAWSDWMPVGGDWDLHLRLLIEGDIAVVPQPLANWHVRPGLAPGSSPLANVTADPIPYDTVFRHYRTDLLRAALREQPWLAGPLLVQEMRSAIASRHAAQHRAVLGRADAQLGTALTRLESLDVRLAAIDARLGALEDRLDRLAGRFLALLPDPADLGGGA